MTIHNTTVPLLWPIWLCEFSLNECVLVSFGAFRCCHCCCYCGRRCARCAIDRGCGYCCHCCSYCCCCCFIAFVPLLDIGQRYFDLYLLRFIILAITDIGIRKCASPALHVAAIQIVSNTRLDLEQAFADIRRQWERRQLVHAAAGSAYWRGVRQLHGLLGWQQLHRCGSLWRCARHRQQRIIPTVL